MRSGRAAPVSLRRNHAGKPGGGRLPEEVLLEVVGHHLADIVIVTDALLDEPGPRILYVNDRFTELTGYGAEEVMGRSPRLLQGRGTDRGALDRVRKALAAGVPVVETVTNYGRDGTRYELEMRIMPLVDAAGRATHFVAIERDVTRELARKAQRERLEMLLASIVHALDFGVLVHDEGRRCVLANSRALALLGTPIDAVIGKPIGELLPGIEALELRRRLDARDGPVRLAPVGRRPARTVEALPGLSGADQLTVLRILGSSTPTAAEPGAPAPAAAAAATPPPRVASGDLKPAGSAPAAPVQVVAGRMQLVGLDAVREALGAKWEQRRDSILELAEGVLKRRLGSRDIWRLHGEDGFVVVFADTDERASRFKAQAIGEEIKEMLIGRGVAGVGLSTAVVEMVTDEPVDLAQPRFVDQITQAIDGATAALEQRLQEQLRAHLERPALIFDEVRLTSGSLLAHRIRPTDAIAEDLDAARMALADPSTVLFEAQSFLLAQAVRRLTVEGDGLTRPMVVPFDPAVMDSRRSWSELLDLARRIPAPLRRRLMPLLDGRRAEDSAYRLSDAAATLGQIFGHTGLIHPTRGSRRFMADRCRLRIVAFDAGELPEGAEERKRFARLLDEIRLSRAKIAIDLSRGAAPGGSLPPHDLKITSAG